MLRASLAVENAGIPTVSIVSTPFLRQGQVIAKGFGLAEMSIAEYPGVPMTDSPEVMRSKTVKHLVDKIIQGLSNENSSEDLKESNFQEGDIAFTGTLEEVQDYFIEKEWSDGLPIIPPTQSTVEAFLRYTDRNPKEVLGVLAPENRQATIWNVAVNGVMAGCRPEYMPVLIAIVEILQDPKFRLVDAGATPGWEPVVILSGPLIKELDFNCGAGIARIGRRANSSIGRFVRLYIRNIAGSRIMPTGSDKGSISSNFFIALAENEPSVDEIGWQPFSVDQGFKKGANIVTLQSVVSVSPPIYTGGETAESHMEVITEVAADEMRYWSFTGFNQGRWFPLLVLGPAIAAAIAAGGWTKDDIRRHI